MITSDQLQRYGRKGAQVRMIKLSPERRSSIARKAARARWQKQRERDREQRERRKRPRARRINGHAAVQATAI